MTEFFRKIFGIERPQKGDDFSDFIHGKAVDKTKIMKQVLREATEEQRAVLKRYRESTPSAR